MSIKAPQDPHALLLRFISKDGCFRLVSCVNTSVVREVVRRHGLSGLAAAALGRTLTAAQLLATLTKGNERVTLQLVGSGPLRGVVADAWSSGKVRGYVHEPVVVHHRGRGRPRVSRVLGRQGSVTVFRDLGLKEVYQGTGSLIQGEVDEDVEGYLRQSEQIPTALGCEVLLGDAAEVLASVGLMVQSMPGTREQEGDPVREAQHFLRTGGLRRAIERGTLDPALLAAEVVSGHEIRELSRTTLSFSCLCSKERVARALLTLGPAELKEMIEEDGGAELSCHFCGTVYRAAGDELQGLLDEIPRSGAG